MKDIPACKRKRDDPIAIFRRDPGFYVTVSVPQPDHEDKF
jgi:hypothetical protein